MFGSSPMAVTSRSPSTSVPSSKTTRVAGFGQARLPAPDNPQPAPHRGLREDIGQMPAQLAGERRGLGHQRDIATGMDGAGGDLQTQRPSPDHDDRGARGDRLPQGDRVLDGAQGQFAALGRRTPLTPDRRLARDPEAMTRPS